MFGKLLTPFTTATATGVATRYTTVIITTALAVLGLLGLLSEDQVNALKAQVPEIVSAVSGLIALAIAAYGTITKSSSDKAAEAAKLIDEKVPADASVMIKTPGGQPDIVVPAKT